MGNEPYSIPENWIWTTIEDISEKPQYGWTTKASDKGDIHLLRTTDITSGLIDWKSVPLCSENPKNVEKYLLHDDDIVISRAGSVGYSYLIKNPKRSVFASYLIRFRAKINPSYFQMFLLTPYYWHTISENKLGIAVPNVNATKIKNIKFPLAPYNEQIRIIDRVEDLFSRLDAGVRSLQATQTQLEQYRLTTLKQAYIGKLSEKWRSDNEVDYDFTPDKHHYLRSTLSESLRNGKSAKVSKTGKGTPILSLSAVTYNDFSESNVKICDLELETTSDLWVKPGDFLIARSNTIKYVGLGALYHGQKDLFIFPDLMIRARFNNSIILPKFVQYYFESMMARRYFKEKARGTSGSMPKINQTTINEMRIPLPSIEEQKKVIELIEEKISKLSHIKEQLHRSIRWAERLRSSILKNAFEGSLVPQDSKDEPAQVLLERIKVQRVKQRKVV